VKIDKQCRSEQRQKQETGPIVRHVLSFLCLSFLLARVSEFGGGCDVRALMELKMLPLRQKHSQGPAKESVVLQVLQG
jgi:hypothetical protein